MKIKSRISKRDTFDKMDSESENDSDIELQEAFAEGKIKPGLNVVVNAPRQFVNNISGLKKKLSEMKTKRPWIDTLECVTKQAPLAPELAAQMIEQEQKRERLLKGNKKLPQYAPSEDPVINDFKRETMFHRQAQAAVIEGLAKLKSLGIPTKRPDDYFAEMAKTDEHMQKVRDHLMKNQQQKLRSEKVKQLRQQRKEGKMLQIQTKLQQQKDKRQMLDQIKKVRKGAAKNLDFLDGKRNKQSRNVVEKRKRKDKKFGFGGRKKGSKLNTKDSAAETGEYRRPNKPKNIKGGRITKNKKNTRPGKNRRTQTRNKK